MSFYVPWQNTENGTFIYKDTIMTNSKSKKILGVTIDNKLLAATSESYVKKLLKTYWLCQEYQTNYLMVMKKSLKNKTNKQTNKKSGSKISV